MKPEKPSEWFSVLVPGRVTWEGPNQNHWGGAWPSIIFSRFSGKEPLTRQRLPAQRGPGGSNLSWGRTGHRIQAPFLLAQQCDSQCVSLTITVGLMGMTVDEVLS